MLQHTIRDSIRLLNNRNGHLQRFLLQRNGTKTKKLYSAITQRAPPTRFMHQRAQRSKLYNSKNSYYFNNHNLIQSTTFQRSLHLPKFPPNIPNKYELLIQARGFIQRLKVRIKYPLMKQMRPFTLNDITALFSWVFLGHTVWLLVGTTSFISLGLWAANSLQFEEWVVNKVGKYLTKTSEAIVIFESATPNWKDGKIRLNNLHIVCMPKSVQQEFLQGTPEKEPAVVQGDLLAGVQLDEEEVGEKRLQKMPWFDLTVDTLEVELSLMRLMEGKGLVKSANVKGIRGIIDNRRGNWNKNAVFDAGAIRKRHIPGDFEMESLIIDDLLLTVYMPTGFRPFPVSILQAQFSKLRKQWMFYDMLCADSIIGSVDTSLFSVHTPQTEKSVLEYSDLEAKGSHPDLATYYPYRKLNPQGVLVGGENQVFGIMTDDGMRDRGYQRKSRLRVENVSMDHIHRFGDGPPQWITSGTMDFCADIYIPDERKKDGLSVVAGIFELIKSSLPQSIMLGTGTGDTVTLGEDSSDVNESNSDTDKKFIMDIDVRFKNIKGVVPLKIPDVSYLNSAMVRPVIAYINNNKTIVPIKGRIIMDLELFNGAWTIQQSTLSNRLNECVARGFVDLVKDNQERNRRLKQIGFWSFREMIRNIVNLHDYVHGTARGFWSYLGQ